jgi:hyperosmotically inducible periplasmic protein
MKARIEARSGKVWRVILAIAVVSYAVGGISAAERGGQSTSDPAKYQAWLTKEVHHELVMLPWLSVFDNLEYKVEGTKVTLLGQVARASVKSDAGSVVKHLEGVTEVDNQIEVLPPSPGDDRIRREEYRAIYGFSDLYRYAQGALPSIRIIVKNGNVTLEGIVDTRGDKDMVGLRAKTVPGTFAVTNNLRVEGGK